MKTCAQELNASSTLPESQSPALKRVSVRHIRRDWLLVLLLLYSVSLTVFFVMPSFTELSTTRNYHSGSPTHLPVSHTSLSTSSNLSGVPFPIFVQHDSCFAEVSGTPGEFTDATAEDRATSQFYQQFHHIFVITDIASIGHACTSFFQLAHFLISSPHPLPDAILFPLIGHPDGPNVRLEFEEHRRKVLSYWLEAALRLYPKDSPRPRLIYANDKLYLEAKPKRVCAPMLSAPHPSYDFFPSRRTAALYRTVLLNLLEIPVPPRSDLLPPMLEARPFWPGPRPPRNSEIAFDSSTRVLQVLLVERKHSRSWSDRDGKFHEWVLKVLERLAPSFGYSKVELKVYLPSTGRKEVIDTYQEQALPWVQSDIVIAAHGAALANVLLMGSGSVLIVGFPAGFRWRVYQPLAWARDVHYLAYDVTGGNCCVQRSTADPDVILKQGVGRSTCRDCAVHVDRQHFHPLLLEALQRLSWYRQGKLAMKYRK